MADARPWAWDNNNYSPDWVRHSIDYVTTFVARREKAFSYDDAADEEAYVEELKSVIARDGIIPGFMRRML